jgi:hypothetical protein
MDRLRDSGGTRRWQIGFVIGLVTCIVSAAFLLGSSLFTAVVGVATLVVALLNALLSSPGETGTQQKWDVTALKRLLQVTAFTKGATLLLWSTTLAIACYGTYDWYRHLELRNIEGLVVSATNEPLNKALVGLTKNGKTELTTVTAEGKFRFENVDIRGLQGGQLAVDVQYRDVRKRVTVDFVARHPSQLVITMPQGSPPFRVTYFDIEGPAIDFLLNGELDPTWEKRLGGQPFIIPNEIFKEIGSLVKSFTEPLFVGGEGNVALDIVSPTNKSRQTLTEFSQKNAGRPLFVGSPEVLDFEIEPTRDDISSLVSSPNKWRLEIKSNLLRDNTTVFESTSSPGAVRVRPAFFFWRFAETQDVQRISIGHGSLRAFFKEIVAQSLPPEFAIVTLSPLGCGDVWQMDVVARPMKLRIVALENTSPSPLRLGLANLKENRTQGLRDSDADKAALQATPAKPVALLPQASLSPGEKVVIPLAMLLGLGPSEYERVQWSGLVSADRRRQFAAELSGVKEVQLPRFSVGEFGHPQPVVLPRAVFAQYLSQPNPNPALDKVYVWGTSLMMQDIEVDGFAYPVRQYNPEVLAMIQGVGVGSCPYVYTRSPKTRPWHREGHILYGLNASRKEATDEIRLSKFDGTVQIREEDREVSYLDEILVRETTAEGETHTLLPDIPALQRQDGQYISLRRGERLTVVFPGFSGAPGSQYTLVARGYYLPDWKR